MVFSHVTPDNIFELLSTLKKANKLILDGKQNKEKIRSIKFENIVQKGYVNLVNIKNFKGKIEKKFQIDNIQQNGKYNLIKLSNLPNGTFTFEIDNTHTIDPNNIKVAVKSINISAVSQDGTENEDIIEKADQIFENLKEDETCHAPKNNNLCPHSYTKIIKKDKINANLATFNSEGDKVYYFKDSVVNEYKIKNDGHNLLLIFENSKGKVEIINENKDDEKDNVRHAVSNFIQGKSKKSGRSKFIFDDVTGTIREFCNHYNDWHDITGVRRNNNNEKSGTINLAGVSQTSNPGGQVDRCGRPSGTENYGKEGCDTINLTGVSQTSNSVDHGTPKTHTLLQDGGNENSGTINLSGVSQTSNSVIKPATTTISPKEDFSNVRNCRKTSLIEKILIALLVYAFFKLLTKKQTIKIFE